MRPALKVALSYAREDAHYLEELVKRLTPLQQSGRIELWHDRHIPAGSAWDDTIRVQFMQAHLIILLVSDDLLASAYITEREIPLALARHNQNDAIVVPVLVRPTSYWAESSLNELQALPRDAKPISTWPDQDSAWAHVAAQLKKTIDEATRLLHQQSAWTHRLQVTTLVLTVATATFLGLRLRVRALPSKPIGELVPVLQDVVRTTDDLALGAGHYLQRIPADHAGLRGEIDELHGILTSYNDSCRKLRERSSAFRALKDELIDRDIELAKVLDRLYDAANAHCHEESLPDADPARPVADQHNELVDYWLEYATRVEGPLRQMRKGIADLERVILERVASRAPQCRG